MYLITAYYVENGTRSERIQYQNTTDDLETVRTLLNAKHEGKKIFFEYKTKN